MKISTKVALSCALLLGLVLVDVVVAYRQAVWAKRAMEQFEKSTLLESATANDLMRIGALLEVDMMNGGGEVAPGFKQAWESELPHALERAYAATTAGIEIARSHGALDRIRNEQAELALLERIENEFMVMTTVWQAQKDPSRTADQRDELRARALDHWQKKLKPLLQRLQKNTLYELLEQNQATLARTETAFRVLSGMGLFALLVTVVVGVWIVRAIMKPLGEAVDVVQAIPPATMGGVYGRRVTASSPCWRVRSTTCSTGRMKR